MPRLAARFPDSRRARSRRAECAAGIPAALAWSTYEVKLLGLFYCNLTNCEEGRPRKDHREFQASHEGFGGFEQISTCRARSSSENRWRLLLNRERRVLRGQAVGTICRQRYAASSSTPKRTPDLMLCIQCKPRKYTPWHRVTPRRCAGTPAASKIGTLTQSNAY